MKRKMRIGKLKVSSFVTAQEGFDANTLKGGTDPYYCFSAPDPCYTDNCGTGGGGNTAQTDCNCETMLYSAPCMC